MIPYSQQNIDDLDVEAVVSVLRSDFLTQGPIIEQFEKQLAEAVGAKQCIAVSSATAALHLCCLSLGVGNQDIVWTSPLSFVASANAALYCGASIDFVDVGFPLPNISVDHLEHKLEVAQKEGALPKALIVVHYAGEPCDLEKICALSRKYGFSIIEDASHALSARYGTSQIGDCEFSDMTVFSFHPVKIITTGEGGGITTNDPIHAQKLRDLRTHGITRNSDCFQNANEGGWYYEQHSLGLNYRMTDIQAALGVSQLKRLDEMHRQRMAIADRYLQWLQELPLTCVVGTTKYTSALHLFPIWLDEPSVRLGLFDHLRSKNILVNVHYIPIHLQPFYSRLGFSLGDFPNAEKYYSGCLSLPIFPHLSISNQKFVISEVKNYLGT